MNVCRMNECMHTYTRAQLPNSVVYHAREVMNVGSYSYHLVRAGSCHSMAYRALKICICILLENGIRNFWEAK